MTDQTRDLEVRVFDSGYCSQNRQAIPHHQTAESLISEKLQKELGLSLNPEGSGTIISIDGKSATALGTVLLLWQVVGGATTRRTEVFVMQGFPVGTDFVLGNQLLSSDDTILNPEDNGVHVLTIDTKTTKEDEAQIRAKEQEQKENNDRIARRREAWETSKRGQGSGKGSQNDQGQDEQNQQNQQNRGR